MAWTRGKLTVLLLAFQLVFLVLFGVLAEYDPSADANPKKSHDNTTEEHGDGDLAGFANQVDLYYPMFQDVHVMMFIGFGFLMTFLKKYGYGSAGFNFLIAAFVLEWGMLMRGFVALIVEGSFHINIKSMIVADFTAAVVLISFGAVLGKTSPVQLIMMAFFEVIFAVLNEHIGVEVLHVVDVGGSMFVHVFGAYFGLAVAFILKRDATEDNEKEGATYHSDIFSLIGTIFLWMFWPSFNSALALEDARHRAVINTYFSLAACCVVTFAISTLLNKDGKVEMVHIQNATLAGGVAVGTSADLMIQPWGAILIGVIAAMLSVLGFKYIQSFLTRWLKIHDTCGVNNLHGMPGILAAIAGAVVAGLATKDLYGDNLYNIFGARAPVEMSTDANEMTAGDMSGDVMVEARSAGGQAGFQLAALGLTLLIAIGGGIITGLILKIPIWNEPEDDELYEDKPFWDEVEYHEVETRDPAIPMKNVGQSGV